MGASIFTGANGDTQRPEEALIEIVQAPFKGDKDTNIAEVARIAGLDK